MNCAVLFVTYMHLQIRSSAKLELRLCCKCFLTSMVPKLFFVLRRVDVETLHETKVLYLLTHKTTGSDFEFSSCKNSGSSITSSTAYQSRRASLLRLEEQNPKFPRMRLSMSSNGDHRCPLNCRQTTCTNVESVAQSAPLEICDSWFVFCLTE